VIVLAAENVQEALI